MDMRNIYLPEGVRLPCKLKWTVDNNSMVSSNQIIAFIIEENEEVIAGEEKNQEVQPSIKEEHIEKENYNTKNNVDNNIIENKEGNDIVLKQDNYNDINNNQICLNNEHIVKDINSTCSNKNINNLHDSNKTEESNSLPPNNNINHNENKNNCVKDENINENSDNSKSVINDNVINSELKNNELNKKDDTNVISLDSKYNEKKNVINFILNNRKNCEIKNNNIFLRSNNNGKINILKNHQNEEYIYINNANELLCEILDVKCNHEIIFSGICTNCLLNQEEINKSEEQKYFVTPSFLPGQNELYINTDKAIDLEKERMRTIIDKKKLCLVLDLDNTLLHASFSLLSVNVNNDIINITTDINGSLENEINYIEELNTQVSNTNNSDDIKSNTKNKKASPIVCKLNNEKIFSMNNKNKNEQTQTQNYMDRSDMQIQTKEMQNKHINVNNNNNMDNNNINNNINNNLNNNNNNNNGGMEDGTLIKEDLIYPHYCKNKNSIEIYPKIEDIKASYQNYCEFLEKVNTINLLKHKGKYIHYEDFNDNQIKRKIEKLESSVLKTNVKYQKGDYIIYYKLRPGVIEFLRTMSEKYEIYLYTMGTLEHAKSCLFLLDPLRKFFGNRVFSRKDCLNSLKHLNKILPTYRSVSICIDDSDYIWKENSSCIKVHGYNYFPDINFFEDIKRAPYFLTKFFTFAQSYLNFTSNIYRFINFKCSEHEEFLKFRKNNIMLYNMNNQVHFSNMNTHNSNNYDVQIKEDLYCITENNQAQNNELSQNMNGNTYIEPLQMRNKNDQETLLDGNNSININNEMEEMNDNNFIDLDKEFETDNESDLNLEDDELDDIFDIYNNVNNNNNNNNNNINSYNNTYLLDTRNDLIELYDESYNYDKQNILEDNNSNYLNKQNDIYDNKDKTLNKEIKSLQSLSYNEDNILYDENIILQTVQKGIIENNNVNFMYEENKISLEKEKETNENVLKNNTNLLDVNKSINKKKKKKKCKKNNEIKNGEINTPFLRNDTKNYVQPPNSLLKSVHRNISYEDEIILKFISEENFRKYEKYVLDFLCNYFEKNENDTMKSQTSSQMSEEEYIESSKCDITNDDIPSEENTSDEDDFEGEFVNLKDQEDEIHMFLDDDFEGEFVNLKDENDEEYTYMDDYMDGKYSNVKDEKNKKCYEKNKKNKNNYKKNSEKNDDPRNELKKYKMKVKKKIIKKTNKNSNVKISKSSKHINQMNNTSTNNNEIKQNNEYYESFFIPKNLTEFNFKDNDKQLYYLMSLLNEIHDIFYKMLEQFKRKETNEQNRDDQIYNYFLRYPVVRTILNQYRKQVLKGFTFNIGLLSDDIKRSDFMDNILKFGGLINNQDYNHLLTVNAFIENENIKNVRTSNLMWLERALYTWKSSNPKYYDMKTWEKLHRNFWDVIEYEENKK
ncbi:NLI interacting factor-like phosphatase, putative [Plasmodium sp. gorilla clade G2]|uniref:NLI interacting factor-like phosphatase, putative n=1 Tax=Plasmodium sp. gorilla clade G2 TaxID=880535 RepID=UPI000D226C21|nr:NLI interacting factor-like phosphatase, putative [Plasmodium sp. gorilla clade G2]SOV14764.1 NLI interacting factor-like phosphatase, putative [Plasmodium sp. gorilla clade G2]